MMCQLSEAANGSKFGSEYGGKKNISFKYLKISDTRKLFMVVNISLSLETELSCHYNWDFN